MKLFLLFLFGVAVSMMSLRHLAAPYVWISLYFFLFFLYGSIVSTKSTVKLVCLNLWFIVILLGSFEVYFWTSQLFNDKEHFEGPYNQGYSVNNDFLGYAPTKDKAFTAIKYYEEKQLYNVTYTIDDDGLRISPPFNKENGKCVLFFGGSFTFGEGLNDNEAMPYLVGIKSNGKYRIYNFGYHGYGPHQMLSAIEHNLVNNIIDCEPEYVIYWAIVYHADRSGGFSSWDQHGPWYTLTVDGAVKYKGHFDDDKIGNELKKSFLYNLFMKKIKSMNKANVNLFIAIVDKTNQLLQDLYPGVKFHVIIEGSGENYIINHLKKKNIPVHPIEKILPDYSIYYRSIYALSPPYDNHPSALKNERIADYVISHILDK